MSAPSKFDNFTKKDFAYKTVNDHPIETTVCVPKNAGPGKHPVLIHWHGGCLMVGDKMFEAWSAKWLIQFAEQKEAIIVKPNHRLLPEATGKDINEDLASFYDWLKTSLSEEVSKISPGVEADLSKLIVTGESAGGYLAVQSALLFPELKISAIISEFGMLDIAHEMYSKPHKREIFHTPFFPDSVVDDYVKSIQPGAVRTSTIPPKHWDVVITIIRQGRLLEFLGDDKKLYPMQLLDEAKELPPMWLIQGKEDELVLPEIQENFLNKVKKTHPQTPTLYSLESGNHGFDGDFDIKEPWIQEGCDFISKYWP